MTTILHSGQRIQTYAHAGHAATTQSIQTCADGVCGLTNTPAGVHSAAKICFGRRLVRDGVLVCVVFMLECVRVCGCVCTSVCVCSCVRIWMRVYVYVCVCFVCECESSMQLVET